MKVRAEVIKIEHEITIERTNWIYNHWEAWSKIKGKVPQIILEM